MNIKKSLIFLSFVFIFYACSDNNSQNINKAYNADKARISNSFNDRIAFKKDTTSSISVNNKLDLKKETLDLEIKTFNDKNKNEKRDSLL